MGAAAHGPVVWQDLENSPLPLKPHAMRHTGNRILPRNLRDWKFGQGGGGDALCPRALASELKPVARTPIHRERELPAFKLDHTMTAVS